MVKGETARSPAYWVQQPYDFCYWQGIGERGGLKALRSSKRDLILDSIMTIVDRDGIRGLTFDAVAAETGITRGGLIYHFPSREALVQAAHQRAAAAWESMLVEKLGKEREAATTDERLAAYVMVATENAAGRADLALLLESAMDAAMGALWLEAYDRWVDPAPDLDDENSIRVFIARLAADGLWMHDALLSRPLPQDAKDRISQRIVEMIKGEQ